MADYTAVSSKRVPYYQALYQLAHTAAESSASPHSPRQAHAGLDSPEDASAGPTTDKKISCMECRASKVKCSGGDHCSRCRRLGKECYYKSHKRGRKSDSSKIQKLEQTVESLSQALEHISKQPKEPLSRGQDSSLSEQQWTQTSHSRSGSQREPNRSGVQQRRHPSASWLPLNTNHTTAPTPDDPDEPDNLGLPTLSNPLKLLAHASDSARDRELDRSLSTIDPALSASQQSVGSTSATASDRPSTDDTVSTSRFGPARGKAFFSVGLFAPRPDNLPEFDPVQRRILSLTEAESLFAVYMQYINPPLTLLDEHLHTFAYVRSSSGFLLTAACWIAAKYRVEGSQIASELESHIRATLLPAILLDGYRSAEIAQAFIILAAYHPPTTTLAEDRSWSYVGYAIRIASELDMNSKIASKTTNSTHDELVRRLRNRERTWLNLYLFETSLSQHMGRRPTLASDPVVMGCAKWHLDRCAIAQDAAMVAVVQLRLLMTRNIELFENFVDVSSDNHGKISAMHVELFRKTSATDLDTWLATWINQSEVSATPDTAEHSHPPQRLQKAKLYYWYARLILDTMALKCSHLGLRALRPIYIDAYASAMAYLDLFVNTMVPNGLLWGHNSTVVTPAYCAIFALRVTGLVSSGKAGSEQAANLHIEIDAVYTFNMVDKVIKVFEEADSVTDHRQSAAGSYAPFLAAVLLKAKSAWSDKQSQAGVTGTGQKRQKRSHNSASTSSRATSPHVSSNVPTIPHDAPLPTPIEERDADAVQERMADDHFFHQMMQFQAGPSGVQAIPGQTPAMPPHAAAQHINGGVEWDFSTLDGFLGESLFSDMSFVSGGGDPLFVTTPLQNAS